MRNLAPGLDLNQWGLGECLEYLKEIFCHCNSSFASWTECEVMHTQTYRLEKMCCVVLNAIVH